MMKNLYYLFYARVRMFFGFSASESHGFLVLMILLLFIVSIPFVLSYLPSHSDPIQEKKDQQKLDSLVVILTKFEQSQPKIRTKQPTEKVVKLFPFDPNSASETDFIALGLPNFMASRIIKYRSKGGRFKKPDDLAKIYGLRTSDFERLLPYIRIGGNDQPVIRKQTFSSSKFQPKVFPKVDINTADSTQLVYVKGIGGVLASRIIKFRNKLGGFVSLNQLHEVYGLDSAVVKVLKNQFFVAELFKPTQIYINQADYKTLASHPYIGGKLSGILLNYKKQHGPFQTITDLEKIPTVESEKLFKLTQYVSFDK
jgi:DNA uptake protein ComE-like DNA-binding protein